MGEGAARDHHRSQAVEAKSIGAGAPRAGRSSPSPPARALRGPLGPEFTRRRDGQSNARRPSVPGCSWVLLGRTGAYWGVPERPGASWRLRGPGDGAAQDRRHGMGPASGTLAVGRFWIGRGRAPCKSRQQTLNTAHPTRETCAWRIESPAWRSGGSAGPGSVEPRHGHGRSPLGSRGGSTGKGHSIHGATRL